MKPLHGKKILVVDDESLIREILREEFEALGAWVDEADGGLIAVEMTQRTLYDAVLSDVRMPAGDGRLLAESLYSRAAPTPKLFLCTGYDQTDLEWAATTNITAVFSKPFDFANITSVIIRELTRD